MNSRIFSVLLIGMSIVSMGQSVDCQGCLEEFYFDEVFLNENISFNMEKEVLIQKLGEPDSIALDNRWECGNYIDDEESVEMYYYGRTKFMVSNDKALLYLIDFSIGNFTVNFKEFEVKPGMRISDLEKFFPMAVRTYQSELTKNPGSKMQIYVKSKLIGAEASAWIFTFENETIKNITYWASIC